MLIGAGTKVLGPVYIGDNARIGAGSVVLCNLPANCTAVGVPAEVVRINNKAVNPADDLDQQDLPDVVAQRIRDLDRRIGVLENAAQGDTPPHGQPDRRTAETVRVPAHFIQTGSANQKQRQPLRTGRAAFVHSAVCTGTVDTVICS
mgnify:CR=1 FL=1